MARCYDTEEQQTSDAMLAPISLTLNLCQGIQSLFQCLNDCVK